jgi:hypothetical protein
MEKGNWQLEVALPLLSSFYTWFVCVVCVLADKISTDALCRGLCGGNARRMEWKYGARDLRPARFRAKTNVEKLSTVCFWRILLNVAT